MTDSLTNDRAKESKLTGQTEGVTKEMERRLREAKAEGSLCPRPNRRERDLQVVKRFLYTSFASPSFLLPLDYFTP